MALPDIEGAGGAGTDTDAVHVNVNGEIAGVSEKTTPVDADLILIEDSEASNAKKKVQISNIVAPGSLRCWDAFKAQDPADTKTDYFIGSSLDVKWTEWDPATLITVAQDDRLKITMASQANVRYQGLVQTAPAHTTYTVTAHVTASQGITAGAGIWGILVGEDLITNPTTDGCVVLMSQTGTLLDGNDVNVYEMDDYQYGGGSHLIAHGSEAVRDPVAFLRIYVDTSGDTYDFLYSRDGMAWNWIGQVAFAATGVPSDPATIGFAIYNQNTTKDLVLSSLMFRVDDTSDMFLPVGERNL